MAHEGMRSLLLRRTATDCIHRRWTTVLGAVPSKTTIIAKRFFDEGGGMQLILHAPFGVASTRPGGLALRKRFCRGFNFELQAAATDNGINISLAEQHSFPCPTSSSSSPNKL